MYGRLLLSHAENAILRNDFDLAEKRIRTWETMNKVATGLELQMIRLKNTVIGRIYRYRGQFTDAENTLRRCLDSIPCDHSRYHVMHHLADVYCELGMEGSARKLVNEPVTELRKQGKQSSKTFRRLGLPLAEVYLRSKQFGDAEKLYTELLSIYKTKESLDDSDQIGHVRCSIGLARVAWSQQKFADTQKKLESALDLTERYSTFDSRGFYSGVINLFLAVVHSTLGNIPAAESTYGVATEILDRTQRQYHMPGMGTYFLRDLKR